MHDSATEMPGDTGPLDLGRFLPYRLSVLSNVVSTTLARTYEEQFGLTIPQWRVMAVLGENPDETRSASEIVTTTRMDKVTVSRAVAQLDADGHLLKKSDGRDRRRTQLRLSAKGSRTYRAIIPRILAYERELAGVLSPSASRAFERALGQLTQKAESLDAPDTLDTSSASNKSPSGRRRTVSRQGTGSQK